MALVIAVAATVLPVATTSRVGAATPQAPAATSSDGVSDGVRHSVVRLYLAVFDRRPDPEGLEFWTDLYVRGLGLRRMAHEFMASEEWRSTYGDVDDDRFVRLLYANVLDREPDPEGYAYWREVLARPTDRTIVLLSFSESREFVAATRTAPPEPPPPLPWPAIPAGSGQGRRIIYDNPGQRVWVVDGYDLIVDSYLVSGKRGVPVAGTYSVYSKSEKAWAGHDGITMQWMVRFARGDDLAIGFHAIPRDANGQPIQTEAQLGTFRSSGCVRQSDRHAQAMYAWADIGTPVVVLG